eukprot:TRINITY_DN2083_c0_g2_i1.p1 TRINITY_DN2083_c0_g2~~TRINITY_DN2083_c0_g2_i1.p1  ORF type:complete len:1090 (-),score=313.72 TRINITY_DN2083_c0_g2_i1:271-3540(-)
MPPKGGGGEAIRVIVRCRPLSDTEISEGCSQAVEMHEAQSSVVVKHPAGPPHQFTFDSIYTQRQSQKDIFMREVLPLCESVLQGYNSTVFAYGQTGSGKTFTMTGKLQDPSLRGMMPHAIDWLFDTLSRLTSPKKKFRVSCSYLELYLDECHDLLAPKSGVLQVRLHPQTKNFFVEGLTEHEVNTSEEAMRLFISGTDNRHTASTNMNRESSRSHSIFALKVHQEDREIDPDSPVIMVSKLNLVDLAGSERQSKTGAEGATLKEGCKINLSLSALGAVIDSIVKGASVIPIRSNPLTMLLKDSLGGTARTVMFANVSPASKNVGETVSTLQFADRAKKIKNKPLKNMDPKDEKIEQLTKEVADLKAIIAGKGLKLDADEELQQRVAELQRELADVTATAEKDRIEADEESRMAASTIEALQSKIAELTQQVSELRQRLESAESSMKAESGAETDIRGALASFVRDVLPPEEIDRVTAPKDELEAQISAADASGALWSLETLFHLLDACRTSITKGGGGKKAAEERAVALREAAASHEAEMSRMREELRFAHKQLQEVCETKGAEVSTLSDEVAQLSVVKQSLEKKLQKAAQKTVKELERVVAARDQALSESRKARDDMQAVQQALERERAEVERKLKQAADDATAVIQGEMSARVSALERDLAQSQFDAQKARERSTMLGGGGGGGGSGDGGVVDALAASASVEQQAAAMVRADKAFDGDLVGELRAQLRLQVQLQQVEVLRMRALESLLRQWRDHKGAAGALGGLASAQELAVKEATIAELKTQHEKAVDKLVRGANRKLEEAAQVLAVVRDEKERAEQERNEIAQSLEEMSKMNEDLEAEAEGVRRKLRVVAVDAQSERQRLQSEIEHWKGEMSKGMEREKHAAAELQRIPELTRRAEALEREKAALQEQVKQKMIAVESVRETLKFKDAAIKAEQERVEKLQDMMSEAEKRHEDATVSLRRQQDEAAAALMRRHADDLAAAKARAQESQDADARRYLGRIGKLEGDLADAADQMHTVRQRYEAKLVEVQELEQLLEELKERQMTAERAAMSAQEGAHRQMQTLMRADVIASSTRRPPVRLGPPPGL